MRFNRNYELTINNVVVRPPMRIVFTCDKSVIGGLNKMTLQVYNLKQSNRLAIVKDAEEVKRIPIVLKVGYGNTIDTIFKGTVHIGRNERQGSDYLSYLESLDGGIDFLNSFTSKTVQSKNAAVSAIVQDMPNTALGKITEQPELTRPKVLMGNSFQLIQDNLRSNEACYIDNEQLNIILSNEVITSYTPIISASTGLLNTPQKDNKIVTIETLMNPEIKIGGRIDLRSTVAPHLNGIYKVQSMQYNGDYEGSDWKQTLTCYYEDGFTVI